MGGEDGGLINNRMNSFYDYIFESKIPIPASTHNKAMQLAAAGIFSIVAYQRRKQGLKLDQSFVNAVRNAKKTYGDFALANLDDERPALGGTVNYSTADLPERYRKGMKLKPEYPIRMFIGDLGDSTRNVLEYIPQGHGRSGMIRISVPKIPGYEEAIQDPANIAQLLKSVQDDLDHELQHATQDIVLRKKHADQFKTPQEDESLDDYYASDIEFLPQITTAAQEFRNIFQTIRGKQQVNREQLDGLFRAFVTPGAPLPQGFIKWKPYLKSPFIETLYRKDRQKWKKAVKEIHRLVLT